MLLELLSRIRGRVLAQCSLLQANLDSTDRFGQYRDAVLAAFGVRPDVQDFMRAHSTFEVGDIPGFGGGWYPPPGNPPAPDGVGRIVMARWQAEGTLHENSHVWWHWQRLDAGKRLALVQAVVDCANLTDPASQGTTQAVVDFLRVYVHGNAGWPGMYVTNGKAADISTAETLKRDLDLVCDWEIYAGLASFTMGRINDGPRALTFALRAIFSVEFTGEILATPYYGG